MSLFDYAHERVSKLSSGLGVSVPPFDQRLGQARAPRFPGQPKGARLPDFRL
jgi:hypothetical protein